MPVRRRLRAHLSQRWDDLACHFPDGCQHDSGRIQGEGSIDRIRVSVIVQRKGLQLAQVTNVCSLLQERAHLQARSCLQSITLCVKSDIARRHR